MSLAATIDAMVAAGCTPEQIAAVVHVHETQRETEAAARRQQAAEKKRIQRARVPVCPEDTMGHMGTFEDTPSPPSPKDNIKPLSTPTPIVSEGASAESEFSEFWEAWPNKVGKPVAAKAFASARKRAAFAEIMAGLSAYVAAKPVDRPWLNPATFLNQDRFHDAPATAAQPRAAPVRDPPKQEIRNPALRALQRLSQKNEQFPDETDIFAPGSDACQRTIEGGSSAPETGASPGGNGEILAFRSFR